MKGYIFLLLSIFVLVSCNEKPVEKPDRLINKETMIDILYDISVLQASVSFKPDIVNQNVEVEKYIYEKYGIDSLTLHQNQRFYASDVEDFNKMYKELSEKIKNEETIADSLSKSEKKVETKETEVKRAP
ncbi:DUF4296 domain-containing protein [Flavobacterium okayamense]|uniref:Lipoprotein n=1 Tax=Flavobacterium okayamense TaxID=2830782 RepID=A0ABM7S5M1_9FLAO|nr:DUF4296 domain-containing protein [Flavobacterium okayamense]BCY28047.1 lipoprotein precursor [Flavobacterium okayamense]